MSISRNFIMSLACGALSCSAALQGQTPQPVERNALYLERIAAQQHVQPGQRHQADAAVETIERSMPSPERVEVRPMNASVANGAGRVVLGSANAAPSNAHVVPGSDKVKPENSAPANAHVILGSANVPPARANAAPAIAHVVPGSGKVRPARVHVVPEYAEAAASVKQAQSLVRPAAGNIPLHTVPGSRAVAGRPVVVQRALPASIAIEVRSANCPYVTLTPWAISKKGDYIELNDGSLWKVRHRNRKAVKKWNAGDAILIETGGFFSWYTYKLVNYSRNESVDAELSLMQGWQGRSAHHIIEVNPFDGYVRLEDGTIWRMSGRELADWHVHDDVIIAVNKDWFSQRYSYVLVNPRVQNRFIASFSLNL